MGILTEGSTREDHGNSICYDGRITSFDGTIFTELVYDVLILSRE